MRTSGSRARQAGDEQAPHSPAAGLKGPSAGAAVPPPLTADALRAVQGGAGNSVAAAMIARRARPAAAPEETAPGRHEHRGPADTGVHQVLRSAGSPLPGPLRQDMEARFGTDFSDVRLHTGKAAADSARSVGARAYTSGSHVVIGDGGGDRHTLAHELTHVVQQRRGPVSGTDHGDGLRISDPSDRFEREAEANAHRVLSAPAPARSGPGAEPSPHDGRAGGHRHGAPAAGAGGGPVQRAVDPGVKLLRGHDPAPDDTTPLRDWATLRGTASDPSAVDVHQILLTYQKLSNGWSSGMGEVQQALSNKFGADNGVPESKIEFGPVVNAGGYPRGSGMIAAPLTSRGPAGSDATTGAYAGLGGAVEGHLLNAHLHGPATQENLAPFRKRLNAKHSRLVEEPLKQMIYNDRGTFFYQVIVEGSPTDPLPDSIICHVKEYNDDGTEMDDGYEQKVRIDQDGKVTVFVDKTDNGPGPGGRLDFERAEETGDASEIALLWNQLRFPWTRQYGEVVKEVLETAYQAVAAYGLREHGAAPLDHLLPTQVTFRTGTFRALDEDGDTEDVEMGVEMIADPLTLRPPAGQVGFEPEGGAWGLGAVRGHLLNHHLHGPAEPRNLAPMSNSLNQQFERTVESRVKTMVLEEGRMLRYEVSMSGSCDRFGFEDVPAVLEYRIYEYLPDPRTGVWRRQSAPLARGTLSNESESDYEV
jgi:hypothetical protein